MRTRSATAAFYAAALACALAACSGRHTMIRTLEEGRPGEPGTVRVAVLHLAPEKGDRSDAEGGRATLVSNWRRCEPLIRRAAALGAAVVVTPEYSTSGNQVRRSQRPFVATRLPDAPSARPLFEEALAGLAPTVRDYARLSAELGVYLVTHVLERADDEDGEPVYFNTMVAFDPEGRLAARYRKINLYFYEHLIESSGDDPASFDTPYGRFGMLLCFDAIVPWTVGRSARENDVDYWIVQSLWQQVPLPGQTAMSLLANFSGRPVLWSNRSSTWGVAGGAGIIRPGQDDTAMGMLSEPGVVVANLPVPERVLEARLPR